MTPLEKARELVEKYYWIFGDGYLGQQHIQCALIAVDEIINIENIKPYILHKEIIEFYQEVKQEIENL
jgi:hypothetical protein